MPAASSTPNGCPYEYFRHWSARQRAWRDERRFIVFCGESHGLGAWLKGLVSAAALSIITSRALVVGECATSRGAQVARYLPDYFEGHGFNWSAPAVVSGRVRYEHVGNRLGMIMDVGIFNATFANSRPADANVVLEMHATEHSGPDKLVSKGPGASANWAELSGHIGPDRLQEWFELLHTCVYRHMLRPTPRLLALEREFYEKHNISLRGDGTPMMVAMHVRLGDRAMAAAAADANAAEAAASPASPASPTSVVTSNHTLPPHPPSPPPPWHWRFTEKRASAMRTDAAGALACFRALGPGERVLITDTAAVATCAARSGVATTQGEAVHLGMRDRYERDAVDKLMLDWWLLSRASAAGTTDRSTLLSTARQRHGEPALVRPEGCRELLTAAEKGVRPCTKEELELMNTT